MLPFHPDVLALFKRRAQRWGGGARARDEGLVGLSSHASADFP